jgi:multidrug efflux pump subunit AcrB
VDHRSGNDYFLTVQYPEDQIERITDLEAIPIRGARATQTARLSAVTSIERIKAPSQVDHYQLRRVIDVFVGLESEDLGRVAGEIEKAIASMEIPSNIRVELRGMVQGMRASFRSFAFGMTLAIVLLYFILVAQFRSWIDPGIILLAFPPGLTGVIVTLLMCGTTLNVMSLMGLVMLAGVAVSNSILLVEFTNSLRSNGMRLHDALIGAARTRLRPILMTSLATIIGLIPMALKLGEGSESYAPLAQAIIGGLTMSVVLTGFLVPAAYLIVYRRRREEVAA